MSQLWSAVEKMLLAAWKKKKKKTRIDSRGKKHEKKNTYAVNRYSIWCFLSCFFHESSIYDIYETSIYDKYSKFGLQLAMCAPKVAPKYVSVPRPYYAPFTRQINGCDYGCLILKHANKGIVLHF